MRRILAIFHLPLVQMVLGRSDGSADSECRAAGGWGLLLPLGTALQRNWLLGNHGSQHKSTVDGLCSIFSEHANITLGYFSTGMGLHAG